VGGMALLLVIGGILTLHLRTGPQAHHLPVVTAFNASSIHVQAGQPVTLTAKVANPGGDPLVYEWVSSAGQIVGRGDQVTLNTSDIHPQTGSALVTVSFKASDQHGGATSAQKQITVGSPAAPVTPSYPMLASPTSGPGTPPVEAPPRPSKAERALEHLRQAETLFQLRQYDAAIKECERGLKLDPGNQVLQQRKAAIERVKEILNKPGH